ncbi:MAG: hypothetical protein R3F17_06375 [Planctomycetota bacterium]
MPTILPPGGTAHLLLGGTVDSAATNLTLSGVISAAGPADCGFSTYAKW